MNDSWLPDFVFAGFPRTGSQFLQRCLQLHPDIDFCIKPRYFNLDENYSKGLEYYASLLSQCSAGKLIGEGDEHYLSKEPRFADPLVICDRIHSVVPRAKILICIRNQVDFLLSGFRMWKRSGISAPFSTYMAGWPDEGVAFAQIANFHPYIAKYISLFGEENVKVLLHEDLADDQTAFLDDTLSFLGVSTQCTAEVLSQVDAYHHVNPAPSRALSRVFDFTNSIRMKKPGLFRWVFPIRVYRLLAALEFRLFGFSAGAFRDTLSVKEIEEIRLRYGPGNNELSCLIDIDLGARGYPV